jgi:hypothetical protein
MFVNDVAARKGILDDTGIMLEYSKKRFIKTYQKL